MYNILYYIQVRVSITIWSEIRINQSYIYTVPIRCSVFKIAHETVSPIWHLMGFIGINNYTT